MQVFSVHMRAPLYAIVFGMTCAASAISAAEQPTPATSTTPQVIDMDVVKGITVLMWQKGSP